MGVKPYLPHQIIEIILSRIPVKPLFRFKSVCKLWNSVISDPKFIQIYLKQSKKSWARSLVAWEKDHDHEFYITKIQNNEFQIEAVIEYPWEEHDLSMWIIIGIVCYCDGLYLWRFQDRDDQKINDYILWNPSTQTYKKLSCPCQINDHRHFVLYGIGYDPLTKDYKIVIADLKHYAVFSCRTNKWGEVKEMTELFSGGVECYFESRWLSFNGSSYWILRSPTKRLFEIICFDFGDEKMKKMHKPDVKVHGRELLDLVSIEDHLCLLVRKYDEMRIMKIVGDDSWIEFKVLDHLPFNWCIPCCYMCCINEDEILLEQCNGYDYYQLYDQSNDTFVQVQKNLGREFSYPIPYMENLIVLEAEE